MPVSEKEIIERLPDWIAEKKRRVFSSVQGPPRRECL